MADIHSSFHCITADVSDRVELVADVWHDDDMWGGDSEEDWAPVKVERLIHLACRDLIEGRPPKEAKHVKPAR